ncbi:MAG: TonB-dependent receptor [Prevotella sp.]|nr:TonB-dependent receptor [Prevotella sp.]
MKQVKFTTPLRMFLITLGLFLYAGGIFAQDITVNGYVKDANEDPVIGATISVDGKAVAVTDFDGNFTAKIPEGKEITVSYVGFTSQTVKATPNVVVTMTDNARELDQVVVIGYGRAKKTDLTGSVTAMKPDDINKGLNTSAQDMLIGKIAGVSVISNDGAPGGAATIRIRGGSSLNASNDPLIVIDGLAMDNYGVQGLANPLSLVNPNDIESFTVLKDASATAIYGSRASNGVIIITTKKGKKGSKPHVSYSGNVSVNMIRNKLDVLDKDGYMNLVQNAYGYSDEEFLASEQYANLGYYDANGNHLFANTDWQSEIYRTVVNTDHNINVSGGLKNMPYRVSFGYTNQDGIVKTSSFNRYTLSFNVSPSFLNDHLTLNINGKGMYAKSQYNNSSAIGAAVSMDPTKPVYGTNASYNGDANFYNQNYGGYWQWAQGVSRDDNSWLYGVNTLATGNPVSYLDNYSDKGDSKKLVGNIEIDYKIHGLEDLHLHVNGGMDVTGGKTNKAQTPYTYDNGTYYYGNYGWNTMDTYNLSLNAYAQYIKDFTKDHHFDIMGGYEWQHFHKKTDYYYYGIYPDTANDESLRGTEYSPSEVGKTLYKTENYLVSFFGRLNYSYKDRYLLTATLRGDGSSRFAKGHRWGVFPSVALAWRVKEETFLKNVDAISDFKVRLGYGITGQQEGIGDYNGFASYTVNNKGAYYPVVGDGTNYRPDAYNPELTWEKTTTYNAGIDMSFLNDRVTLAADYYYRKTTDLINTAYVAAGSNFASKVTSNIGGLHNQGVEFSVTYRPIQTKDWSWELGYNITYNQNRIDDLIASQGEDYTIMYGGAAIGTGGDVKAWRKGESASAFYVYQQVYDEAGQPIEGEFVDRNGDGVINADDRYFYKKADASVLMGLTSKLIYKHWDFSFSLRASLGNYNYNAVEISNSNLSTSSLYSGYAFHNRPIMSLAKNWQTDNVMEGVSDYAIQNASFLKCDNITLGYSFDKIGKAPLGGRVYATVQNVFTITDYKGLDPEVSGGYDSNIYPRPIVAILGLSLNF